MKYLWKKRNNTKIGSEPNTLMAIIWLHSYACCPISRLIPTGTVRILFVLVSASANRY